MRFCLLATAILLIFYGVYIGKMISQKKRDIQTNQMAKGKKEKKVYITEMVLRVATCCIVVVQLISMIAEFSSMPITVRYLGFVVGIIGDGIFALAVWTMHDSWRAGIPAEDKTTIITDGIYKYSRNPAFLGFYLMYIGILLMFFNWILLAFTVVTIIMLHLQILQEEQFLPTVFGEDYVEYKAKVSRYLGRKLKKGDK